MLSPLILQIIKLIVRYLRHQWYFMDRQFPKLFTQEVIKCKQLKKRKIFLTKNLRFKNHRDDIKLKNRFIVVLNVVYYNSILIQTRLTCLTIIHCYIQISLKVMQQKYLNGQTWPLVVHNKNRKMVRNKIVDGSAIRYGLAPQTFPNLTKPMV